MKTNLFSILLLLVLTCSFSNAQEKQFPKIDGVQSYTIELKQSKRTYDIFCPADTLNTFKPLVIMFHGGGGNSKEAAYSTNWIEKAKKENFIIVFPNGERPDNTKPASFGKNGQSWNDGSTRSLWAVENNIDDVGFIRTLIDTIKQKYKIDTKRIYATGFSNGASMTFRLGVECSDIFAAIAPVSGTLWLENPVLKEPISLLYINGDSDPLNPLNGGNVKIGNRSFGNKKPISQIINLWTTMLSAKEIKNESNRKIQKMTFQASNGNLVEWITVKGMGHHWPGGEQTLPKWLVGKPSNSINATDTIWDFFKTHPK